MAEIKFDDLLNSITPIFIVGMPRSGTTLVEQIIASHNDVYGAGELVYIQKLIKENFLEERFISFAYRYKSQNNKKMIQLV